MEMRSAKGVGYFTAKSFGEDFKECSDGSGRGAVNAFATRIGGVSAAPFDSLDFSAALNDRQENLSRLGSALGIEPLKCALVKQVHGETVVRFDPTGLPVDGKALESLARTRADAIVTSTPGIAIGVLTADCLPILLFDPVGGAVGAVHAGWRGTFSSIVKRTVAAMTREYGVRPADLRAALGPCIGACCYTVQSDFYENFLTLFGEAINGSFAFSPEAPGGVSDSSSRGGANSEIDSSAVKNGSIAFDLQSANRRQLLEAGVLAGRIDAARQCTCCNPDLFFSYRRDVTGVKAKERAKTGRMLSMVMATSASDRGHGGEA